MHERFAAALDRVARRDRRDPARQLATEMAARAAALADARSCGRRRAGPARARSTACPSRGPGARTRCRSPACATTRSSCAGSRSGCGATGRRSSSTTTAACCPSSPRSRRAGERRMSANPHANGGELLRDLVLPDFRDYARRGAGAGDRVRRGDAGARPLPPRRDRAQPRHVPPLRPGRDGVEPARRRLRVRPTRRGSPPSSRSTSTSRRTDECWRSSREHLCQGWLEGYLLTGRHGLFNCYEAFIHIVDSMFNQHAKWLKVTREIPWRRPIASLNYLLSSHVWRQDHNGFSHQDPGFIDHVVNKKAEVIRVYLPPDANTLLSVADHCLRSRNYVNVIVAGQAAGAQLPVDRRGDPPLHARARDLGVGLERRRRRARRRPRLRRRRPDARDRRGRGDPARAPARAEGARRQRRRPDAAPARQRAPARALRRGVRLALHDRPAGRLRLPRLPVADPPAHLPAARTTRNLHVRGYKEEGTTTTPFDMVMLNDLDRFHLVDRRDRPRPRPRRPGRRTCGRRWSTGGSRARAYTRDARRRRPGDPGLDLAALTGSSSSTRARRASSSRSSTRTARRATRVARRRRRRRRRGRASGRPRRPRLRRRRARRRRRASRRSTSSPPLAPLHTEPALRGARAGAGGAAGRAARRRLRLRLPPHDPGGGVDLRDPAALARGVGRPPLRLPRARRRSRSPSRSTRRAARRLPPRRRLLGHGRPRRPLGRHDDGLHARSRACRWRRARARSTPARSSTCCASRADRGRARPGARARVGARTRSVASTTRSASRVFTYRVAQAVAAMAAALGGVDVLAFSRRRRREPRRRARRRRRAARLPRRLPRRGRRRPRGRGRSPATCARCSISSSPQTTACSPRTRTGRAGAILRAWQHARAGSWSATTARTPPSRALDVAADLAGYGSTLSVVTVNTNGGGGSATADAREQLLSPSRRGPLPRDARRARRGAASRRHTSSEPT